MTAAAVTAALSIPLGALLGVLYDLVRLGRLLLGITVQSPFGKKGVRRWIAYILAALGDFFFCTAAGAVLCVFFFLTGDGRMRGYGLLGAALGFYCYYQTLGRLIIALAERVCAGLRALARRLAAGFCKTPLVTRTVARYNEYKDRKQKAAAAKKRKKRMRGGIRNGL